MAKLGAIPNGFRAVLNRQFLKKMASMMFTHAARPAVAPMAWQMLVELLSTPTPGIRLAIDRFVTEAHWMTFQPHPASDLFRRPPGVKTAAHGGHGFWKSDQLTMDGTAVFTKVLGVESVLAVQVRLVVQSH